MASQRLSLGIKQLSEDPWQTLGDEIRENEVVTGKVVHIADFGVFLEIKPGVEGLIHVSEINREVNKKSLAKFYPIGSEIQARIINLKVNERRMGLSVIDLAEEDGSALDIDTDEDFDGTEAEPANETPEIEEDSAEETDQPKSAISLKPETEEKPKKKK